VSDIFVSYANADRHRVKPLVDALLHQGWSVWWDRAVLPGTTWDQAIETALAEARCVIVLWSRNSIQSDWVRTEAEEAKKRGILVPALLDDVNIPLAFKRLQAANLVEWSGVLPSAGFSELARGVSEVLSRTASPAERATPEEAEHDLRPTRKITLRPFVLAGTSALALIAGITWYVAVGRPPIANPDTNGQSRKTTQPPTDEHAGSKSSEPENTPLQVDGKRLSAARGPTSRIPADEAVNFKGAWRADIHYPLWDPDNPEKFYHEKFQFEILGGEVIGSASLLGTPRAISEGSVHGPNISFITKYHLSDGMQENWYRGSISGDRIQFTYQDADDGALIHFAAMRVKP
jgi:hypothetical protein